MEPKEETVVVEDESVLDKELEETLSTIKAGQESQPQAEVKPEEKAEVAEPKVEEPSNPQAEKELEIKLPLPSKNKFESDETWETRAKLMELIERKKAAKTDSQKQSLSEEIKNTRKELAVLGNSDKVINPLNQPSEVVPKEEEDETIKADRERLKQLGGATKEDIEEIIQSERLATEVKSTLEKFVDRHEVLKDEDTREVFFDFVDANYNWQGKSGKDLMTVLELARESMFKPSETIQERVLKGANVQEKVNAMQFPGGTIAKTTHSPEVRASLDEMMKTGISEEKALELISD
jgi:hypothetical protein